MLIFGSTRINSNTTEGEIVDAVALTKGVISTSYGEGDAVATDNLTVTDLFNPTLSDSALSYGTVTVTPGVTVLTVVGTIWKIRKMSLKRATFFIKAIDFSDRLCYTIHIITE